VRERCKRTLKRELNESLKSLRVEAIDRLSGGEEWRRSGGRQRTQGSSTPGTRGVATHKSALGEAFGKSVENGAYFGAEGFTSQQGSWRRGEAKSDEAPQKT
jgi:hypothetical protein